MKDSVKLKFIDMLWKSKRGELTSESIRDSLSNIIFAPFSSYFMKITTGIMKHEDDNVDAISIYSYYCKDQEFREYVNRCEVSVEEKYKEYVERYMGLNSLIAAGIRSTRYESPEHQQIADTVFRWYSDERMKDFMLNNGSVINFGTNLNVLFYDLFIGIVGSIAGTFVMNSGLVASLDVVNLFSLVSSYINGPIQAEVNERNIPVEVISNYFFAFDIDEEKLEGLRVMTAIGISNYMSEVPLAIQNKIIKMISMESSC